MECCFFVDNECVVCGVSPSQRGDEGVCYGEGRGLGRDVARYSLEKHVAAIGRGRAFVKI